MKILNKLLYRFTKKYCFEQTIKDGNVTENKKCGGRVGGDKLTDFLSYDCIDCKYFDTKLLKRRYK